MNNLEAAVAAHNDAVKRMNEVADEIETLDENATVEQLEAKTSEFDLAEAEVTRTRAAKERFERIAQARKDNPIIVAETPEGEGDGEGDGEAAFRAATPKGGKEELIYRPDGGPSFFRDLVNATKEADVAAAQRLHAHQKQAEARDISTTATAGGGFVPPIYMGELFADIARPGRPFADVFPSRPLPPHGMTISIPRITTGPAAAIQTADNAAVNETDLVEATLSVSVRTIAGQQDISQQLLDRSDPSIDSIVFGDLRSSYDMQLDTQLLAGSNTSGQHLGIRGVSGVNTVTYTDSTPTAAELVPKLYDGIQKVASNRYANADTIVMTPARAGWLASNLSSTFPLFQLGNLTQASGSQNDGFVGNFAGLKVVLDANISGLYGASTNEDEIYIVRSSDLILWEGPLQTRVAPEVLSGNLTVRVQLFGYSAFASGRYPKAITVISGTGLTTPSF